MTLDKIEYWIDHSDALNAETLIEIKQLMQQYPYFQSLKLLYLKNLYLLHDIKFGSELRKNILFIADRVKLFQEIEGGNYAIEQLQKLANNESLSAGNSESEDRTLDLINSFLSSVVKEEEMQEDFEYSVDYAQSLLNDEDLSATDEEPLSGQELIDSFIKSKKEHLSHEDSSEGHEEKIIATEEDEKETTQNADNLLPTPDDNSEEGDYWVDDDEGCFTETLAKIYIKQHKYEKALEIIKKLSLKYPKKNVYFVDQIGYLEKLIINIKSNK